MGKKIWLGLAVVALVVAAVSIVALPKEAEWTTDSPEALAEFVAAVDAQMKLYHNEVQAHLEKALEFDPDFIIAKLYLADKIKEGDVDKDRALRLWNDVLAADKSGLTEREQVIIERARALRENRFEDAGRMLDDYLAKHPNDPFLLHRKALSLWISGDFDAAELLNRRLIEIAPNWVIAYNQLGYISMSRGRFAEAEEYFTSYRFVAPDQANPHDSLGELYLMLGRYDEAETSLLRSIGIKPDFWAAYDHLAMVRTMIHDYAGAEDALARAVEIGGIPEYWEVGIGCILRIARLEENDRFREILATRDENPECFKGHSGGHAAVTTHRAACLLGEWDIALSIEEEYVAMLEKMKTGEIQGEMSSVVGMVAHMHAVRLAVEGDFESAIEGFVEADENLTYMQAGSGLFKLYNRLLQVETFLAAGMDGKAHKLLSHVRSVNPRLVEDFEEHGLKVLGLERE